MRLLPLALPYPSIPLWITRTWRGRPVLRPAALGLLVVLASAGSPSAPRLAAAVQTTFYVSPSGSDSNSGSTAADPVQTIARAQQLVRSVNSSMTGDVDVILGDGFYRMTAPLTLGPSDSGTNGFHVVWMAAPGARPVLAGSDQITGWSPVSGSSGIYWAQGPTGIRTRQLYVNGSRAARATGTPPSAATLGGWRDPSGQFPPEVEFVYPAGAGGWTELRCPVASVSGGTINMAQPCWNDSTMRGTDLVGGNLTHPPSRAENAYQLLTQPGQWYLDTGSSRFYYMPLAGQDMTTADVEAPVLESLVTGGGTATSPLHDVFFQGIEFAYATWMGPSTGNGFSEVQANYLVWGPNPTAGNATFDWYQVPGNVGLTYDQDIHFTDDGFIHLGGAGLALGDGSQNDVVQGDVITDTSANALELGNVDMPGATGSSQTLSNTINDNWIHDTVVEFHGGVGIDVAYAANTSVDHNQVNGTPYSGMSIGWGGWSDKIHQPGLTNFSHNNDISYNLVFDVLTVLNNGGGIYNNGQTSASHSYATGATLKGNVLHDSHGHSSGIGTDNGTDWMTITGNAVWNFTPYAWGDKCLPDYYPGEGGGRDNQIVQGNYWMNGPAPTTDPHCQISNNTTITGASGVPASILNNAGLEPAYQSLLSWQQAPNPPVGGRPPACGVPMLVASAAGTGAASLTWTPAGGCPYYAIYAYSPTGTPQMFEAAGGGSFAANGLTSGSYYTFTMIGWSGSGWVGWSAWAPWILVT